MKKSVYSSRLSIAARCVGMLALAATLTLANPRGSSAAPPRQSGVTVTAVGELACPVEPREDINESTFSFTFDPEGGPVTGHVDYHSRYHSIPGPGPTVFSDITGSATLTGTFEGGDGGRISGEFSGVSDARYPTSNGGSGGPDVHQTFTGTWEGYLRSNGIGEGVIVDSKCPWTVTFDAELFQAVLGIVVIPTGVAVPVRSVELTQEARDFIASSPRLSEATKGILNQDSVIFARDDNNHFYVINNHGKAIQIPGPVSKKFDMSNDFTLLHGGQTHKGLIGIMGHPGDEGSINGGANSATLAKIPSDLKDHDYGTLSTECSGGGCATQFRMNSTAASTYISSTISIGNAWHTNEPSPSVRGTINGGGDFIYAPDGSKHVALVSLSQPWSSGLPAANNPVYLGVQAQDGGDGAVISMIQRTSPAERAGLVVGDKVVSVSGAPVDSEHSLGSLISQNAGGTQVDLGIERNGSPLTIPVRLASLLPSQIITPSAEITVGDHTELAVDIGFNGVTGVLVLGDSAHVREPVTGSEVEVPAGSAVIVVPGYAIGDPIQVREDQITRWWEGEQFSPAAPVPVMSNLLIGVGGLGLCGLGGLFVVGLIVVLRRRQSVPVVTRPVKKPLPPERLQAKRAGQKPAPPEQLKAKSDGRKSPPPEKLS